MKRSPKGSENGECCQATKGRPAASRSSTGAAGRNAQLRKLASCQAAFWQCAESAASCSGVASCFTHCIGVQAASSAASDAAQCRAGFIPG
jgi:hypothetical protein